MAATTTTETMISRAKPPRTTKLVCFSYAAYAKNLIDHLKSLNIPILPGLNDAEFSDIESTFNFTFPPDLRFILREGLPAGPAFPNWRSSSHQQLRILVKLPVLSLSKNVSLNNFWSVSWGQRPQNNNDALSLIKKLLDKAPLLVPIYRNCYVPSTPNMAGNPVFYIDTEEVRVLSFDLAGFFKQVDEFVKAGGGGGVLDMPAWAAKEPRTIEFWTDLAERGRRVLARCGSRGRWWRAGCENTHVGLECCMDEVFWRLRDGGWREEEVREMMMVVDGHDDPTSEVQLVGDSTGRGSVERHVRLLSLVLLRAGWSKEDVVYSLNLQDHGSFNGLDSKEGKSNKSQHPRKCSKEGDDDHQKSSVKQLRHVHALPLAVLR
ncbi:hypothetical protein WN944_021439 [Citrus x changshan-huyou]|uniref:Uncharacterized protein n=1 Tax=Citrus x changshan-huyou TaxID=2935761 RepID=A0AAP0MZ93_9ROSI